MFQLSEHQQKAWNPQFSNYIVKSIQCFSREVYSNDNPYHNPNYAILSTIMKFKSQSKHVEFISQPNIQLIYQPTLSSYFNPNRVHITTHTKFGAQPS